MPGVSRRIVLAAIAVLIALFANALPVVDAQYIPSDVAQRFTGAVRQLIIDIVDFLTPIIDIICAGMIIVGLILAAGLRQEFYGIRLIIGGGIGLLMMHIVVPVLLSFL
ncbi:MAG: hypothetical protein QXI18_04105 [Nitrososphaerota archaeon]